ncbi:MAG TPA: YraN family protein [Thermodesulfobacteriota bacterium]|nr:YraN family protein [Thermodesulfobacteriota bacterium]
MFDRKTLGQKGEKIACRALKKQGYRIIKKNFRCRQGEIDIIAEDSATLCFIEVKSRYSQNFGLPEESVTKRKQGKLYAVAAIYLERVKTKPQDMRFDIVSVDLKNESARVLKNAFEVSY